MKDKLKKYLLPNLPYLFFVYLFDKLCQTVRLAPGLDASEKLLHIGQGFQTAFSSSAPSFHALDICVGILGAVFVRLAVYVKGKNAKKYRKGMEYGSARWGTAADIAPYIDPVPDWNIPLTRTESLTMTSRPKDPKTARNKNILVIGGSGSGKTRFFVKPSIMQMHSSYVITDPKGQLLKETGKMLLHGAPKLDENGKPVRDSRGKVIYEPYRIKVLNTINFSKSMKYNPLAYVRSEKDILKLVNVIIANTKGDGEKSSEDFWVKAERLLYCALIGYIWYEAEPEERNFITLLYLLNACEAREDDETYKSPVDILFDDLAKKQPEHFAVKQYVKFKMAAGKTAKSILVSVGVRLAAFNLPQIARLTMTDELHLDDLGERRVALFCCIPDSDKSLNYLVGMVYTQLIQTLFYQADRVHRGRLPVPVHCLMDEFPNISLPKDSFQSALATMRSRGIFCSIIVQNIAQLKSMYKDSWESLVGLCDEFLYLGGNEQGTHKYVSELIGKETVETTSRSLSRGRSGSSSTSHQQTARDLMTPDEVRLLSNDKALLFVRGERPVMDWKYNLLRHPNIRFTEDGGAPPYDYTVAPDAHEDLAGNAENYELLDMDDFLPAAEQPKPMFTYPRRNAHASQQD